MTVLANRVRLSRDVPAVMRDGTVLRSDIYRPTHVGRYPVILMRVPYNREIAQAPVYQHPSWYASHGYIVIVQDCRGRFGSDGEFDPLRSEAEDGYDSVQWAAEVEESDGNVGMYGFSYAGATQLLAAAERPPALRCCVPAFTASDCFDGWMYEGGAFKLSFIMAWVLQMLAPHDAHRRGGTESFRRLRAATADIPTHFRTAPLAQFPLLHELEALPAFFDWIAHSTRDDYWRAISVRDRYDDIEVPCLHIGGWYDIFGTGTVQNFRELHRRAGDDPAREQRLVMGPWIHVPWAPEAAGAGLGESFPNRVDPMQLAWFDKWLKGIEPAEPSVPVQHFAMGANQWRTTGHWPEDDAFSEFRLASGGRANSRSGDGRLVEGAGAGGADVDVFVYDPNNPVVSAGGTSCCNAALSPMGQACQAGVEVRNDVLVYTSSPLKEERVLLGTPTVVVYAATSGLDTDWVVRLTDVNPDGVSVNISQGVLRARFRDSLSHPGLVEPHQVYRYEIPLAPTSWVFHAGHRIRLQVTSSDYPSHAPNLNTGGDFSMESALDAKVVTQMVFHDTSRPSALRLPLSPQVDR